MHRHRSSLSSFPCVLHSQRRHALFGAARAGSRISQRPAAGPVGSFGALPPPAAGADPSSRHHQYLEQLSDYGERLNQYSEVLRHTVAAADAKLKKTVADTKKMASLEHTHIVGLFLLVCLALWTYTLDMRHHYCALETHAALRARTAESCSVKWEYI